MRQPAMRLRSAHLYLVAMMIAMCHTDSRARAQSELTATDIIARMKRVYKTATSYQDSGTVIQVSSEDGSPTQRIEKPFKTAFVRPNLFFYQFTENRAIEGRRLYVVWADGKAIRSWWTVMPAVESFKAIGPALYGPMGVSGGSADRIPRLLLGDSMKTWALSEMTGVKLAGREHVGKTECYKITGIEIGNRAMTVLIGTGDLLVRKTISETDPGFTVTTVYRPHINIPISRKTFAYTPPK